MKTINLGGLSYIEHVPGATNEWYYGIDYEHGDLYEAEDIFKAGKKIKGRTLRIVHYPDGCVYDPVPKTEGCYSERPIFFENSIYIINVDFKKGLIQIIRFECTEHKTSIHAELPLSEIKKCYNLILHTSPLTLTRQGFDNDFQIIWPEKVSIKMEDHDSFFLRDGDKLYFNRWYEEGEGADYRYWEKTIIKDLNGNVLETFPGDVMVMPNGEFWHLK